MEKYQITDSRFRKYGRVITELDFTELLATVKTLPMVEGMVYKASEESLKGALDTRYLSELIYGGKPLQVGYCSGHNKETGTVEYHHDIPEVNIAVTDLIVTLGRHQGATMDCTYDTSRMESFFIPAGTAYMIDADVFHGNPCNTEEEGFMVAVILPEGMAYSWARAPIAVKACHSGM